MELHLKHRPTKLKDVIGQKDVLKSLVELGKKGEIPHAILLTGPSGTGKTTIARILKNNLQCSDVDFVEMNGSDNRGIDDMRTILKSVNSAPMAGKCRIWMIDECHALTADSQRCILKVLEDTPRHVYFMLCTTDPQKLIAPIKTRCTEFRCKALTGKEIIGLVTEIADREGKPIKEEVAMAISRCSEGSARQAVKILNSVIGMETMDQLKAVQSQDLADAGVHLGRLLFSEKTTWVEMRDALKELKEDHEKCRHAVLGYCQAILLGDRPSQRAAMIMEEFRDPFYDTGKPGLVLSCYNVIHRRN